ncbi:MAG TPA: alpha-E domain-containing protein [Pseudonocardia sp.]|jgi:uncharacterized alpha-E superfamily protein|nr:alpha-E domain-containing protein [Pseudonocardia sp.]
MLLSRCAESLYWAGRYLERAEATARLIKEHTEPLLDRPRSAAVDWFPLMAVTGCRDEFVGRKADPGEDDAVEFLTANPKNRGAVVASIARARANLLASRAVLTRPSWEVVNNLHGWVMVTADQAIDRRTRLGWIDGVISQCQLFASTAAAAMPDDEVYGFLQIGRHLERADITLRVLDVHAGILVDRSDQEGPAGVSHWEATWTSVLRSLSAQQLFVRTAGAGASGAAALRFLLQDDRFPRSVESCLTGASQDLGRLPSARPPAESCGQTQMRLRSLSITEELTPGELNVLVDDLEKGIGDVHAALTDTYFRLVSA